MKRLQRLKTNFKIFTCIGTQRIAGYIVILLILFGIAFINNKVIELALMLFSYTATKEIFPATFHCKNDQNCVLFTIFIFGVSILICFNINISILASVVFGLLINLISYLIENTIKYFSLDHKKSNFIKNCNKLNIKNSEMIYEIIYSELSDKELANKFYIEVDTVKHIRWKVKKKFKENDINL